MYLLLIPYLIMVLQDFFMTIVSSSIMEIIVLYTFLLFSPESNVPPEPSKLADCYAGCDLEGHRTIHLKNSIGLGRSFSVKPGSAIESLEYHIGTS